MQPIPTSRRLHLVFRCSLTVMALAVVLFSVFGFLACNEYAEWTQRVPWQCGYGAAGAVAVYGIVSLWWRGIAAGGKPDVPPGS